MQHRAVLLPHRIKQRGPVPREADFSRSVSHLARTCGCGRARRKRAGTCPRAVRSARGSDLGRSSGARVSQRLWGSTEKERWEVGSGGRAVRVRGCGGRSRASLALTLRCTPGEGGQESWAGSVLPRGRVKKVRPSFGLVEKPLRSSSQLGRAQSRLTRFPVAGRELVGLQCREYA